MNELILEILPSPKSRNAQLWLGRISAIFALMLGIFILFAGLKGVLGTWTIVILIFPMLLFLSVSWFVRKFGVDYIAGLRIYSHGAGVFFPLIQAESRHEEIIPFSEVDLIEMEETLEVHRMGRRIKKVNVYRLKITKTGDGHAPLMIELTDLLPSQILVFRQIYQVLTEKNLLPPEKIDRSKMPM